MLYHAIASEILCLVTLLFIHALRSIALPALPSLPCAVFANVALDASCLLSSKITEENPDFPPIKPGKTPSSLLLPANNSTFILTLVLLCCRRPANILASRFSSHCRRQCRGASSIANYSISLAFILPFLSTPSSTNFYFFRNTFRHSAASYHPPPRLLAYKPLDTQFVAPPSFLVLVPISSRSLCLAYLATHLHLSSRLSSISHTRFHLLNSFHFK